jgi:hypothetical protein
VSALDLVAIACAVAALLAIGVLLYLYRGRGQYVTVSMKVGGGEPLVIEDLWLTGKQMREWRRGGLLPEDITLLGPAHPDHPRTEVSIRHGR